MPKTSGGCCCCGFGGKKVEILKMDDVNTLEKLEEGFQKLKAAEESDSLLKMYLTPKIFDKLKVRKTRMGATLLDVIQSGVENLDSLVGVYAPDADSYTVFSDLLDPIIIAYHAGFKSNSKHPPKDFGNLASLVHLDPDGEFVVSTRVRCGRSLEGYPFNPCMTEAMYKEIEKRVSTTLSTLTGGLQGTYQPLTGMKKDVQQQLIDDHFLFSEGDKFRQAANSCKFWPTGRGIFYNDDKTFLVWVNEEDHLRIISMEPGGDLAAIYTRMVSGVNAIEETLKFSRSDKYGFLTFCPTNLGTTVRASVHIKLPKLTKDKALLDVTLTKFNLQVRGSGGEHSESGWREDSGGVCDISNKRRLGLTEFQAVKEMEQGVLELIKIEKSL